MVGRVLEHVVKDSLVFDRVTPYFPLQPGEGKVWTKNRLQRRDEHHLSDTDSIEVGRQIQHSAHQQAARGPSHGSDPIGVDPAGSSNKSSGVYKIGERVLLGEFLAVFVPGTAQFAATPNVGDNKDDAA